jgi:peptidyl-tRNA hydrolase
MKAAMYIFINKGLGMSPGKIAAQAGHAAVEAALLSHPALDGDKPKPLGVLNAAVEKHLVWNAWRQGLHYAKYVMEARDAEHLRTIKDYLEERGFKSALIIDEGHTEIEPITATALGVALVDKDDPHTAATFSSFKLYREPRPQPVFVIESDRLDDDLAEVRKRIDAQDYAGARRYVRFHARDKARRHWPVPGRRRLK